MESLVANYASSDEEEEVKPQRSLPKPSLSSLPPPKSQQQRRVPISLSKNNIADDEDEQRRPLKASLLNLPPPKSQQTRRIVQFRPSIPLPTNDIIDDEEEEKERERKRRRESQSQAVRSGKCVLSMIPPPKNSLSLGSSSSSARRISVPNDPSPPKLFAAPELPKPVEDLEPSSVNYYGDNVYSGYVESGIEEVVPEMGREMGRRGGKAKIVEVKQDELMKNRPRQDPTPAASFGPAYPAVSAKGKPTKLHKRKHQIGSLYFDMRQKESELAERRSKGFLTKAETQAKYGW